MTPDADDVSPSPDYSGDQDLDDMAEIKELNNESDSSPRAGTAQPKPASSNAKDPLRPRRKKARRACFACQRAHLTCGEYEEIIRPFFNWPTTTLTFFSRRRKTLSKVHQARPPRCLP